MNKMETDSSQMPDKNKTPFSQTLLPVVPSPGRQLMTKKSDMYYSMAHKNRGKAILINMIKFKRLGERKGAEKDMQCMKAVFTYLQFRVVELENKTSKELMSDLQREAQDESMEYDDCLVVVIMTHGCEDYLSATDALFKLESVTEKFKANNCTPLAGKPKLFFIQACRGEGVEEAFKALDANETPKDKIIVKPFYFIPNSCDILEFHSSTEGKIAAMNTEAGSWFIQSLATELQEHGFEKSLLDILSLVIQRVAIDCEYHDKDQLWKQLPILTSTLTRSLKFDRKIQ